VDVIYVNSSHNQRRINVTQPPPHLSPVNSGVAYLNGGGAIGLQPSHPPIQKVTKLSAEIFKSSCLVYAVYATALCAVL